MAIVLDYLEREENGKKRKTQILIFKSQVAQKPPSVSREENMFFPNEVLTSLKSFGFT